MIECLSASFQDVSFPRQKHIIAAKECPAKIKKGTFYLLQFFFSFLNCGMPARTLSFFLRKTYLLSLLPRAEKARDFPLVEAWKFKQKNSQGLFSVGGNEGSKEGLNGAWLSLLPYHIRRFKRRRGEKGAREKKKKI